MPSAKRNRAPHGAAPKPCSNEVASHGHGYNKTGAACKPLKRGWWLDLLKHWSRRPATRGRAFTIDAMPLSPEAAARFGELTKVVTVRWNRLRYRWHLVIDNETVVLTTTQLLDGPRNHRFTVKTIDATNWMPPCLSERQWREILDDRLARLRVRLTRGVE